VDDVVVAQVQTFLLDDLARTGVGTHVEAEQHGVGGQRQVGVALGDAADAAGDHAYLDLFVAQLGQGTLQRLQGAAHIGLEHDVEGLLLVLAHVLEQVLQDRKSTRLNSSHVKISYAVFCLKKKKKHGQYLTS